MKKNKHKKIEYIDNKIIGIGMIILGIFALFLAVNQIVDETAGVMSIFGGTLLIVTHKG